MYRAGPLTDQNFSPPDNTDDDKSHFKMAPCPKPSFNPCINSSKVVRTGDKLLPNYVGRVYRTNLTRQNG